MTLQPRRMKANSEVTKQPGPPDPCELIAEVPIDPQMFEMICRRGHRRLREIESSSQAALKLHRSRGVLEVRGSKNAIDDVCRQLEFLSGLHLPVSTAVWAELMRTRTNFSPAQSALARIQQQTESRVHIERTYREVRLFGPKQNVALAQRLIEELEGLCVQKNVDMANPLYLDQQMLRKFADEFGVTFVVEATQIVVLGIKAAVAEAAQELRKYECGGGHYDPHPEVATPSEVAQAAIADAIASLVVTKNGVDSQTASLQPIMGDNGVPEKQLEGAVIVKMPPPSPQQVEQMRPSNNNAPVALRACPTCGCAPVKFCAHCGEPVAKVLMSGCGACATCGTPNFCSACGHAIEKIEVPRTTNTSKASNMVPVPMQSIQTMPAMQGMQTMMMPNGMMAMCVPAGLQVQQAFVMPNGMMVDQQGYSNPSINQHEQFQLWHNQQMQAQMAPSYMAG